MNVGIDEHTFLVADIGSHSETGRSNIHQQGDGGIHCVQLLSMFAVSVVILSYLLNCQVDRDEAATSFIAIGTMLFADTFWL